MNSFSASQAQSSFSSGILSLLERVEYRRVATEEDLEDIDRLRRKSYYTSGIVDPAKFGSLVDKYDRDPSCHVIGIYLDEQLMATVRLHIVRAGHLHGPVAHYFPQRAEEYTQNAWTYIDPSRLATDPEFMWQYPMLPLIALRTVALALEYFLADHSMSVVRPDLARSYKKFFGSHEVEPLQQFDGVAEPLMLLVGKFEETRAHTTRKLPFFQSTDCERRMLFAPKAELEHDPIIILPTAKYKIGVKSVAQIALEANPEIASAV